MAIKCISKATAGANLHFAPQLLALKQINSKEETPIANRREGREEFNRGAEQHRKYQIFFKDTTLLTIFNMSHKPFKITACDTFGRFCLKFIIYY